MKKLLVLLLVFVLTGCRETEYYPVAVPQEAPVKNIPLASPLNEEWSEISGMDWYGDQLIFLPQYPDRFESTAEGNLYRLGKEAILNFLDSVNTAKSPLNAQPVTLVAPGLADRIDGFQGFEAIAFDRDTVFLTIEADNGKMAGYLIRGMIDAANWQIILDVNSLRQIPMDIQLDNTAYETILLTPDKVIAIYEANGRNVNPHPYAKVFDRQLRFLGNMDFPAIEYRVTDATRTEPDSSFWVSNYFWSPDRDLYKPAEDELFARYGKGATHRKNEHVERLIHLKLDGNRIGFLPEPPIQIELVGDHYQRNWEGLVLLDDRGFLIVTDKFPETIFAFIPKIKP